MNPSIVAIAQARMGSNRLPGKVLMTFNGEPSLMHFSTRVKQAKMIDKLIIATSTLPQDDAIEGFCQRNGIVCCRGSESDVLDRYYNAALEHSADFYVRLTADSPLIDPYIIDATIKYFLDNDYDYISNGLSPDLGLTFPRGMDCEVFSSNLLVETWKNAKELYEREHVTPYMYKKNRNWAFYHNPEYTPNISNIRLTLDTPEDFNMISKVYDALYHGKHDFYLPEILEFLAQHPDVIEINSHVRQKTM